MSTSGNTGTARREWPQLASLVIGVVYLLVGIAGFFVTGFENFASHSNETLLGFEVNPLHNIVHILIGAAGIALAKTLRSARTYGWLLAIGYGATFIYGLFAADRTDAVNFLSINWPDNWLHLVSALAGLVIALGPVRTAVDRGSRV